VDGVIGLCCVVYFSYFLFNYFFLPSFFLSFFLATMCKASEERSALRKARTDRLLLEKRRAAVLDSKLDVIDHARRTLEKAFEVSPAPVSMVQVHKVIDYHSERGTLPRHHAVRLESFSRR
jgi:hypothetical protein